MVNVLPTVLYSCMAGMVIIGLLELISRAKHKQNRLLAGVLLLLLIHLAGELYIYSGAYVFAPGLAGIELPFRVLLGPALFLYAHAAMSANQAINKKLWFLITSGPVLVLVGMLPFIFVLTPADKLALANPATRDPELWQIAVFTCLFTTCVFIVYTLLFLAMSFKLHTAHNEQLMERFSEIERSSLAWFKPILWVWGIVWILYSLEFTLGVMGWNWFGSGTLLPVLETVALAVFIHKALSQKPLNDSDKGVPQASQPRTSILSVEKMQTVADKLQRAMQEDKLFLQEDLSLNKLSESIAESENHISETLSQHLNTKFFQFVNNYRVEEAKNALKNSDDLITNIAFEVGFNSKSTFNTAFKKMTGHSPSVYRNLALNNQL